MNVRYWIFWAVASIVLLLTLPWPWYSIGTLSLTGWFLYTGITNTGKQGDPWHRTKRLIYKALDDNEAVHYQELVRVSQLPPWVVKLVLEQWKKKDLVREDRELFNLTMLGMKKLEEEFGEV